ncbi:MAG TPA: carboxypeptidase regulatory-like domain-containing protein [Bryobacteraceae bacterium]|nr:carboxypeptidase regulatory-like domain-containing protein [Bryobacteraceae bacterium]
MREPKSRRLLLAILSLLAPGIAAAQVSSSSLLGVVTDLSGAAVANVKVTARQETTGFTRTTRTGLTGQYRIDDLNPGSYIVKAERPGFVTELTRAVTLEVNQKARVDLHLRVGPAASSITVEATASPVASDDASIGYRLDSATVLSLPLSTRDVASLVTLGAGAVPRQLGGFVSDVVSDYQGARGSVQQNAPVNGGRATMNGYTLDGAINTDRMVFAMAVEPPLESVQEFRIVTSQAPAEFSQAGGAVVDVVTKSGQKSFHGTLFDYFRNEATDARGYFEDPALPRAIFRQNQFGASAGGPAWFKDTFFFATYEGVRGENAQASTAEVPTSLTRSGDFSGGSLIYDPLALNPGGNSRLPFPDNTIPSSRIDPIAAKYLQLYEPLPNSTNPVDNYLAAIPNHTTHDSGSGRIDHQFHDQSQLSGRYTINDQHDQVNSSFPLRPAAEDTRGQQVGLVYTRSRGNWLNEARFSFTRLRVFDEPQSAFGANVAADLGVTGVSSDPFTYGLPYFLIGNYATLTDDPTLPKVQRDNSWNYSDGLSFIHGAHTMKAGFQGIRFQLNYLRDQNQRGQFTYTGAYTQDLNNSANTGDAFADFLLGYPQNTLRNVGDTQAYLRQTVLGAYVQDDWRAAPRLTLNFGLRYEYTSPWSATRDNLLNIDFSHLPATPTLKRESSATNPDLKNFAPRIGVAWRLPGGFFTRRSTTFRAGYGIYYSPEIAVEIYDLVLNGIQSQQNQADGIAPVLTTANGFPQTSTSGFPAWRGIDSNARTPYIQQWQGGFQSELPGRTVLEVAYVGTKGNRLGRFRQDNTALHTMDGENLPPRPGDLQSLLEFPTLGPIVERENEANSMYHSLQARVQKRLASRLTVLASFVWAKSLDDADSPIVGSYDSAGAQDERNLHLERGLSFANVGRRLAVNAAYAVPNAPFLKPVFSNWKLGTVLTFQDGTPLNPVYYFTDFSNTGTPNRPNVVPGASITLPSSRRTVGEYFNIQAFSDPAPYTFGNAGRDIIPGPGNEVVDLSLERRFPAGERATVNLRGEVFNSFNHPNFGIPLPYPDFTGLFGKIFGAGEPRRVQFALRFEF